MKANMTKLACGAALSLAATLPAASLAMGAGNIWVSIANNSGHAVGMEVPTKNRWHGNFWCSSSPEKARTMLYPGLSYTIGKSQVLYCKVTHGDDEIYTTVTFSYLPNEAVSCNYWVLEERFGGGERMFPHGYTGHGFHAKLNWVSSGHFQLVIKPPRIR